ncbi:MAG: EamA family transporter [Pseudonocardiaceae bacterium]|nr:EamA family transporter [Pseudonocardiaceae bacterium]
MRGTTNLILGSGFVVMWSSGFIGSTLAAGSVPTTTLLMWRFLLAGGLLLGWRLLARVARLGGLARLAGLLGLAGLPWPMRPTGPIARHRLSGREILLHSVVGLLAQGVFLSAVFLAAELGVPAGTAALIAALQPVLAAALSGLLLGESTSARQWLGLAVGLAGVALVVSGDLSGDSGAAPIGYTLPFVAMLSLVAATFVERRARLNTPIVDVLTIQCVASAALFGALAVATGTAALPSGGAFWFALAWVVVLCTFGAYGFYWANLRRGSVTRVSSLLYLTPPTTMLWAYAMFGQRIDVLGLVGLAICAVAVTLVVRGGRNMSASGVTME